MSMEELMNGMKTADKVAAMPEASEPMESVQEPKLYTITGLCATDIFPMVKILKKIGIKDFATCFSGEELGTITESFDNSTAFDDMVNAVGFGIAIKVVDMLLEKICIVEEDIYTFLSGISNLSPEEVGKLPMDAFFEMILEVFTRKEFMGFIKVVSRFVK